MPPPRSFEKNKSAASFRPPPDRLPKVTLQQVARVAGVAVGTASRVLNGAENVDLDVRRRVDVAISTLNYKPLRLRQKTRPLAGNKSVRNLGLVLLGMDDSLVHVPVLTEILHGIETSVTQMNGNLLLANLPNADQVPAFLRHNQIEGLIIKVSQYFQMPSLENNALVQAMHRFPRVWIWAKPDGAPGDLCSFNHESAAQLAAAQLAAQGHRRVAYLNPKKGKSSLEHLKKEFQFACQQHGLSLSVFESASPAMTAGPEPALEKPEDVVHLVAEWLALPKDQRPTAAFVPADNIAIFIYRALEARGITVGRDLSIISCNHEKAIVHALKPALTTIEVNARHIGTKAVEQLLWRIGHPRDAVYQTLLVEPSLIEGQSVARLTR